MNSAEYVSRQIESLKNYGIPRSEACWQTALLCVGWAYVYGAWGAECTVAERKKRYNAHPEHTTIKTACKAFNGGSCDGCKWYPDEERTRCFDCRGFTDWILKQYGFDLQGEGATSQWNTEANWCKKGKIGTDPIPKNVLVNLFYVKKDEPSKMAHTGFGYNGETCECSSNVQHFTKMASKWTHWAVAKCFKDELKEDDDMAIPISKFAHLRVIASGLSVAAIFARSSARGREVIKNFSESVPGEREEMPHAIGIEGGFTPAFFGNHAFGEGELFAFVRTCVDDTGFVEIVGKPHDDDCVFF